MTTLKIKTHKAGNAYTENYFFILSKGLNSGKPLAAPCANCFVLFANSEEEKSKLYWICFGLWQGNFFHPFLTGSVIPFIRLDDLKSVINNAYEKAEMKNGEFQKSIETVRKLQLHQESISKQLQLIKQVKKALMYRVLK